MIQKLKKIKYSIKDYNIFYYVTVKYNMNNCNLSSICFVYVVTYLHINEYNFGWK